MSRRARAAAFLLLSLACAGLAAALAGGYEDSVAEQLGELRPVVVAGTGLPARRTISPRTAARELEVRRVPARFVPSGTLATPAEAIGRAPAAAVPAGSYLLGDQLEEPRRPRRQEPRVAAGRTPVEITVGGAGSLAASGVGAAPRVDVVVTTEPGPGGRGRTFVAAERVRLLDLVESGDAGPGEGLAPPSLGTYVATLALTRHQALRLIQAESFARGVRLIPRSR